MHHYDHGSGTRDRHARVTFGSHGDSATGAGGVGLPNAYSGIRITRLFMNESSSSMRSRRHALLRQWHRQLATDLHKARRSVGVAAVHDARVGARRLRMVLKALKSDCQPTLLQALLFDLRDLGRALAPVRDADVRRQHLAPLLRRISSEFEAEADRLLANVDQARTEARQALQHQMREPAWALRLRRVDVHLADDGLLALPRAGGPLSEQAALDEHLGGIQKKLGKKTQLKQDPHALRIKAKRARYLSDFLAGLHAPQDKAVLENLKTLQDELGELHDYLQLERWLGTIDAMSFGLRHALRDVVRACITRHRRQLEKLRGLKLQDA